MFPGVGARLALARGLETGSWGDAFLETRGQSPVLRSGRWWNEVTTICLVSQDVLDSLKG